MFERPKGHLYICYIYISETTEQIKTNYSTTTTKAVETVTFQMSSVIITAITALLSFRQKRKEGSVFWTLTQCSTPQLHVHTHSAALFLRPLGEPMWTCGFGSVLT